MASSTAAPGIVDLSLSTDDEDHMENLPFPKQALQKSPPSNSRFLNLSDDFDSLTCFEEQWLERHPKKRRLSPAAAKAENTTSRLRAQPTKTAAHDVHIHTDSIVGKAKPSFFDSDPIVLSSSPHTTLKSSGRPRDHQPFHNVRSDRTSASYSISKTTSSRPPTDSQFSNRTTALLASISGNARPRNKITSGLAKSKSGEGLNSKRHESLDKKAVERRKPKFTAPPTTSSSIDQAIETERRQITGVERFRREDDKELAKVKKAKEKEEEKERRRLLKEEKAREKQIAADLAEVNKVKTDKKISTPEMIVDLPSSIRGKKWETQAIAFLKELNVQTTTYDSPVPDVVKWRRKVTSSFNEEKGHWEPVPEVIQNEKHIMCLLPAKDFVYMDSASRSVQDGNKLEAHVSKLRQSFPGCILIIIIEGLEDLMKKNKNAKNRAYQAAALGKVDFAPKDVQTTASRRKKPVPEIVDEEAIEDALLRLQVIHGCLIHHTSAPFQTAEWIKVFTQHISTIPYK